ncbi:hypothetical protein EI94DRAFT_1702884 [Lactarius quietus]|nr:hypothetical protein EI94DRAFT_1702884 [Lactarius quietus]
MPSQLLLQALTCIFSEAKIQQISKQDLIIAQNPAFMCIYMENITLKICANSLDTVLDGNEIKKIHKEAKIQWKLLSDKYGNIGLPWMMVSLTPQLDFCLRMEDKFPLLCLCDDYYKALTIMYADYSHWYLNWVKSKVKCKCPCKCRARSKGKSKSLSKIKYKYTSPPKSKSPSKYKYKSEDKDNDKDETESKVAPQNADAH